MRRKRVTGDSVGEPLLPTLLRPLDVQTAPDLLAAELDQARAVLGGIHVDPGHRVDVYATDVI